MGHPNEEFVELFFERHRDDLVYYTIKDIVRRALEEYQKWKRAEADVDAASPT